MKIWGRERKMMQTFYKHGGIGNWKGARVIIMYKVRSYILVVIQSWTNILGREDRFPTDEKS